MEEQTKAFLSNPGKNLMSDNETKLSKIFDWFKSDFIKEGTLTEYLKQFVPTINEGNNEYLDYNWNLNE